jgi:hypothetical protein
MATHRRKKHENEEINRRSGGISWRWCFYRRCARNGDAQNCGPEPRMSRRREIRRLKAESRPR